MHADEEILNVLSRKVIGEAFTILSTPGAGFLERIYEKALVQALRETGLTVARNRDRSQAGQKRREKMTASFAGRTGKCRSESVSRAVNIIRGFVGGLGGGLAHAGHLPDGGQQHGGAGFDAAVIGIDDRSTHRRLLRGIIEKEADIVVQTLPTCDKWLQDDLRRHDDEAGGIESITPASDKRSVACQGNP